MRRLTALAVAGLALTGFGCRRQKNFQAETVEEGPGLAATVHVADPKTSAQLLHGFHSVEQNAWRWTEGKFGVALQPPVTASQKGAVLNVKLAVPVTVIQNLGGVTLMAKVNGTELPPESYKAEGEAVYRRDVPASALTSDRAVVEFQLDKAIPPGAADQRELGVIVTTVGLEAK